jgi:hypothetical protein
MGFNGQSFLERYDAQIGEMKRLLMSFVISIRDRHNMGNAAGAAGAARQDGMGGSAEVDIEITRNGFPKLPGAVTRDLTKKQWEILLRKYLSQHYSKSLLINLYYRL